MVCELRSRLQDKYSVKAKAQQLMYGVMGYILYFDRGYNLEYNMVTTDESALRAPSNTRVGRATTSSPQWRMFLLSAFAITPSCRPKHGAKFFWTESGCPKLPKHIAVTL